MANYKITATTNSSIQPFELEPSADYIESNGVLEIDLNGNYAQMGHYVKKDIGGDDLEFNSFYDYAKGVSSLRSVSKISNGKIITEFLDLLFAGNTSEEIVFDNVEFLNAKSANNMFTFTNIKRINISLPTVTTAFAMLRGTGVEEISPSNFNLPALTGAEFFMSGATSTTLNVNIPSVKDILAGFSMMPNVTSITANLGSATGVGSLCSECANLKTANITLGATEGIDADNMFSKCPKLESAVVDLGSTTACSMMFSGCSALTSVELTNTQNVMTVQNFINSTAMTGAVSFDFPSATLADGFILPNITSLTLNLPSVSSVGSSVVKCQNLDTCVININSYVGKANQGSVIYDAVYRLLDGVGPVRDLTLNLSSVNVSLLSNTDLGRYAGLENLRIISNGSNQDALRDYLVNTAKFKSSCSVYFNGEKVRDYVK